MSAAGGRWPVMLACALLAGGCASRPRAPGVPGAAVAKVPPITLDIQSDPYPQQAKRQKIAGRVLVEFHIDKQGKAVAARVVEAQADAALQAAALQVLSHATFDTAASSYDATGATAYRYGVRFCIIACGSLVPYPGYEEIVLTGDPAR
ncbi:MAG TPA: TonB family protein [Steroidobacteraceae bacterium]|nr:TonB family protein [Steroidobacteraceae bacterium]